MRASREFVTNLGSKNLLASAKRIQVELFGSLALTGRGHGTDRAVILGLCGEQPEFVDPTAVEARLASIREARALRVRGEHILEFIEPRDLLFCKQETL